MMIPNGTSMIALAQGTSGMLWFCKAWWGHALLTERERMEGLWLGDLFNRAEQAKLLEPMRFWGKFSTEFEWLGLAPGLLPSMLHYHHSCHFSFAMVSDAYYCWIFLRLVVVCKACASWKYEELHAYLYKFCSIRYSDATVRYDNYMRTSTS